MTKPAIWVRIEGGGRAGQTAVSGLGAGGERSKKPLSLRVWACMWLKIGARMLNVKNDEVTDGRDAFPQ
jgi:hypothetical protein